MYMFVLLILSIPRSFYLSECKCLTAVIVETKVLGSLLFWDVTPYVIRRCSGPTFRELRLAGRGHKPEPFPLPDPFQAPTKVYITLGVVLPILSLLNIPVDSTLAGEAS